MYNMQNSNFKPIRVLASDLQPKSGFALTLIAVYGFRKQT
jgi:hypothetical protein